MKQYKVRAMADIVINHRIGTTQGHGGMYNRYDGIPLAWDEHAVTSCTGGLVMILILAKSYVYQKKMQLNLTFTTALMDTIIVMYLYCNVPG